MRRTLSFLAPSLAAGLSPLSLGAGGSLAGGGSFGSGFWRYANRSRISWYERVSSSFSGISDTADGSISSMSFLATVVLTGLFSITLTSVTLDSVGPSTSPDNRRPSRVVTLYDMNSGRMYSDGSTM